MTSLTEESVHSAAGPRMPGGTSLCSRAADAHGGNVFRVARERGWDWREILDFSANINPLGVPGSVRRAMKESLEKICHYPEVGAPELCRAASAAWGVSENQIIAGNGATELLYFLARALKPRRVHLVLPAFTEYRRALADCEVTVTRCRAAEDYAMPLPRIASDVRRYQPDLVLLTNPNNPTGGLMDPAELGHWLAEELPPGTRAILDESFLDFTRETSLAKESARLPGLYVVRSLTKFYALPGLRLGCMIASEDNVRELEKVREPWQTSVLAEQAGVAALRDNGYRRRSLELIETGRSRIEERLKRIEGLRAVPPAANFLLVHCDCSVPDLQAFLLPHKILIRDLTNVEGVEGNAFRIAIRTHEENARLLALLEDFFRSC